MGLRSDRDIFRAVYQLIVLHHQRIAIYRILSRDYLSQDYVFKGILDEMALDSAEFIASLVEDLAPLDRSKTISRGFRTADSLIGAYLFLGRVPILPKRYWAFRVCTRIENRLQQKYREVTQIASLPLQSRQLLVVQQGKLEEAYRALKGYEAMSGVGKI